MAMFIRAKHISDPLDSRVKDQLTNVSYTSSGSEHDADPLFSGPIHAFLDIDHRHSSIDQSDHDRNQDCDISEEDVGNSDDPTPDYQETVRDILDPLRKSDPFLIRLYSDVLRAMEDSVGMTRPSRRRSVMMRLRECGYNAGICKAKWESSGSSLTAGSYEYVDILDNDSSSSSSDRYVVDVEFASEFEVARATPEYARLVEALPSVMVGRGEDVKRAVRTMAEAARRSMKCKGLHLPPWRKRRYMLAKWFGPYRRTVNAMSVSDTGVQVAVAAGGEAVKCRAVGFGLVWPESVGQYRRKYVNIDGYFRRFTKNIDGNMSISTD